MIGLPQTGKTTFIAALWHVVKNLDEVPGALGLMRLQGDQEHLNRICDSWLQFTQVARTNPSSEIVVSMELKTKEEDKSMLLFFPDVSGEQFRQQVEDRQCNKKYIEQTNKAAGALFFIHSGNINYPLRINDVETLAQTIRNSNEVELESSPIKPVKWSSSLVSTQTKLVDLLQILLTNSEVKKPFRIAIILSAWDLIMSTEKITPSEFLERKLPFFYQFLLANNEALSFMIYGISAQGAPLDNEKSRRALAEKVRVPSERIIVKSEGVDSHDITEPLKWLMERTQDEK